jgi:hypothetical protein
LEDGCALAARRVGLDVSSLRQDLPRGEAHPSIVV